MVATAIDQIWLGTHCGPGPGCYIDENTDVLLAEIPHTDPLAYFSSYIVTDHLITIPAEQPPGSYFLMIRVDATNVTGDHNTFNNYSPWMIALEVL